MTITATTTCRLVIADRGFQLPGLIGALTNAGFPITDCCREEATLRKLGLKDMDTLLEISGGQWSIPDFFPGARQLRAWRAFVSVLGPDSPPLLILVRNEGRDPTLAREANQEALTLF